MKRLAWLTVLLILSILIGAMFWVFSKRSPLQRDEPVKQALKPWVEHRSCDYQAPPGVELACYWIDVEAHTLSIAVLSRSGTTAASIPLVYLAGGPGEGNNTAPSRLADWAQWYQRLELPQDFVVIDPRGVNLSQPSWDCQRYITAAKNLWQQNFTYAEEAERSLPILRECYQQFSAFMHKRASSAGIEQFNSRQNAADVAHILSGLGYARWDLLGVSYGTRVAIVAALNQPQVRRLILDSPYPLAQGQLSETPLLWAQAFNRFFDACDQGLWSCPADAQSETLFWQVFRSLNEQPLTVTVEDWSTTGHYVWQLNGDRLAAMIYSTFYSSELYFMIFPALQALLARDTQPAQFLLDLFYNTAFDPGFNNLIFWATECNDNVAETEAQYIDALGQVGPWAPIFASDWKVDICRQDVFFTTGQKPAMEAIGAPTLVAVGAWDPITPATHAQALLNWLPQGLYLPLANHAHAEFFNGSCAAAIIPWFLAADDDDLAGQWADYKKECLQ